MRKKYLTQILGCLLVMSILPVANAQVAGTTTTPANKAGEPTQIAKGWSAKRSVMGQKLYNDSGDVIGKIKDLIVSPDENISYVIVSAGGFLGIASYDVAIPVQQIKRDKDRFILPGATKSTVKAMPRFTYANNALDRGVFIAHADREIALGQEKVRSLRNQIREANSEAKAGLEKELTTLQADLKSAQTKLTELKRSAMDNWRDFESEVKAALEQLRQSREASKG